MQNSLEEFNVRSEQAEERIRYLENRLIEFIQSKY